MKLERYRGYENRHTCRKRVDRLLTLAEYLPEADRLLVEHVYRHGRSLTDLAQIAGQRPRTLQLRLSNLLKHMNSSEFLILVLQENRLSPATRTVAMRVVVQRMSMRQAARSLGQSLHYVRQHLGAFRRACHEQWSEPRPRPQGFRGFRGKVIPAHKRFHKC